MENMSMAGDLTHPRPSGYDDAGGDDGNGCHRPFLQHTEEVQKKRTSSIMMMNTRPVSNVSSSSNSSGSCDGDKSSDSMDSTDDNQDLHNANTKRPRKSFRGAVFGSCGQHGSSEDVKNTTPSSFLSSALADRGFPDRINPKSLDMLYLWDVADDEDFGSGGGSGYNRPIPEDIIHAIGIGEKCSIHNWLATMTHGQASPSMQTAPLSSFGTSHSNETPFHLICSAIGSTIVASSSHQHSDSHRAGASRILQSMMDILDGFLMFDASRQVRTNNSSNKQNEPVRCTSLFVQDNHGRTPLHSLVLGMKKNLTFDGQGQSHQLNDLSAELVEPVRRILLPLQQQNHRSPPSLSLTSCCMLLLFMDQDGKTPFECLQISTAATQPLMEFFRKESIIDTIVSEWTVTRPDVGPAFAASPSEVVSYTSSGCNNGTSGDDLENIDTAEVSRDYDEDDDNEMDTSAKATNSTLTMLNPFRQQQKHLSSDHHMPAMERVDNILNLSGLTEAIMEMGFDV